MKILFSLTSQRQITLIDLKLCRVIFHQIRGLKIIHHYSMEKLFLTSERQTTSNY